VTSGLDGVAGLEYGKLLADLLEDAQKTKASLESRAAGVITTSAALVTLLFGFSAIATRSTQFRPTPAQLTELRFALAAIVAASALGVLVNTPLFYRAVNIREVARLTEKHFWTYADRTEAARYGRARAGEGPTLGAQNEHRERSPLGRRRRPASGGHRAPRRSGGQHTRSLTNPLADYPLVTAMARQHIFALPESSAPSAPAQLIAGRIGSLDLPDPESGALSLAS
jgi:hypothetical protein